MEFKGTKGKWDKGVTGDVKQVVTKKVVADCCFFGDDKMIEQANAQLIAHAPEMFEILKEFLSINGGCIQDVLKHKVKVAKLIKKATTI